MGLSRAVSLPALPTTSRPVERRKPQPKGDRGVKSDRGGKPSLPQLHKDKAVPLSEICEFGDPRAAMRTIADLEERLGVQRFSQVASKSVAIHAAVRAGRAGLVKHMLARGFNPNLTAPDGRTPCYCAVELVRHNTTTSQLQHPDREQVLLLLLEHRANPNAVVAATKETALDAAARYNNEEMVGLLLAHGAKPTVRTKASNRELQKRLPRHEKPAPDKGGSALQRLFSQEQERVQALFQLHKEGEDSDLEGKGWAIRVVSAEGNFATVRVKLGPATFYLSCQQVPLVVTNDAGITIFGSYG